MGWLSLKTKTECIDTRHIKNIPNLLQSFLANTLTVSHASLVNSEKSTGNTSEDFPNKAPKINVQFLGPNILKKNAVSRLYILLLVNLKRKTTKHLFFGLKSEYMSYFPGEG